jgi:hypothetical protein
MLDCMRSAVISLVWLLAAIPANCFAAGADWGSAQFLIGQWVGEGSGQPGAGTGAFSFTPDVQGRVLLRRSFAEYPAAGGKPAARHDDLMVVYHGETGELRAIYFDSEGHVIRYAGIETAGAVVFVSDGKPDEIRYRLTYTATGIATGTATGKDNLKLQFEIAAPGKEFATYLEASARRQR